MGILRPAGMLLALWLAAAPGGATGAEEDINDIPLWRGDGGGHIHGDMVAGTCFGPRDGGGRKKSVGRGGGSEATEAAVEAALHWLARHQNADGFWEEAPAGPAKAAAAKPAPLAPEQEKEAARLVQQLGDDSYAVREAATRKLIALGSVVRPLVEAATRSEDLEVSHRAKEVLTAIQQAETTALALLAFLGAGYTDSAGKFAETVKRAEAWLVEHQADNGAIGSGTGHAIAGWALAEAYGLGRNEKVKAAAQAAVDCSVGLHQKPYSGWGRDLKAEPDLATTALYVMQLKSAKIAGLKVDGAGFQGAFAFIDKQEAKTAADAAPILVCRLLMGTPPTDDAAKAAAEVLGGSLPRAGEDLDLLYLHWGTLAMFQMGGESWKSWNAALKPVLVNGQSKGGVLDGSAADVDGAFDAPAGKSRAAATALGALCLETYYRYLSINAR